jgi:Protein of unknown function (DUF732)
MKIQATVAALALSVVIAPLAHADSQDDQYLSALAGMNINTANAPQLISAGHAWCDAIGNFNPGAIIGFQGQFLGAGVPYGETAQAEIAAGRAYCPDKLHSMGLS